MMVQKKRLEYIDVVAGIMIIWMIFAHCRYFSSWKLPCPNYLGFFMPWFFYKSGLFYKTKEYKELTRKDANKFLRSFIVYSLIGWVIWCICGLADHSLQPKDCFTQPIAYFIHHGSIGANGALWFLLSLFLVRQLGYVILSNNHTFLLPLIVSLVCFAAAYGLYLVKWQDHSWWIGNIFSGLCFFLLGYCLKDRESNWWIFLFSAFFYALVVIAYYLGWIHRIPSFYMHANKMHCGHYFLFFPWALAGIITINNLTRLLCYHIKFRILGYVGRNSMNLYVTHWILLIMSTFIAKSVFHIERPLSLLLLLIGACIIFLPLISETIDSLKRKYSFFNKLL